VPASPPDAEASMAMVDRFARRYQEVQSSWNRRLSAWSRAGRRTVLWGGGSKATGFLHALANPRDVDRVVDINPKKHHTYIAGTGHEIVAPSQLRDRRPDAVVVMNPIYLEEIRAELSGLQCSPELVGLGAEVTDSEPHSQLKPTR
jgi:hypothetical protein